MFAKVAVLIVSIGLCAAALLAIRHQQTQAAHGLTESRLRITQRDQELWRLRSRIAAVVTPQRVKEMALRVGGFQPLKPELVVGPGPLPVMPQVATVPDTRSRPEP